MINIDKKIIIVYNDYTFDIFNNDDIYIKIELLKIVNSKYIGYLKNIPKEIDKNLVYPDKLF